MNKNHYYIMKAEVIEAKNYKNKNKMVIHQIMGSFMSILTIEHILVGGVRRDSGFSFLAYSFY